jgi:RNA polymerase sigma factor (sigma-70 family)
MPQSVLGELLRILPAACGDAGSRDLSDGELLQRFCARREEAAFTLLVERHGPMVLGLCQRILGERAAAEDAFQATFLVLVRRAPSLGTGQPLAGWLHAVGQRVALKARAQQTAQRQRERRSAPMPRQDTLDQVTWQELRGVLDQEIARLPDKYRNPLVLCYFEGKSHERAARELDCPTRSLSNRLVRARELLRRRLVRRGLTLSAAALAGTLTETAAAALAHIPALLTLTTVRAATMFAGGQAGAGCGLGTRAALLAQEAIKETIGIKSKLLLLLVVLGLTGLALAGLGDLGDLGGAGLARETAKGEAAMDAAPVTQVKDDTTGSKKEGAPATDLYGDPLPPGALLRLGSTRLRQYPSCLGVAFSPSADLLVSSGMENTVHFWEAATGKELRQITLPAKTIGAVAFSPDGKLLAGAADRVVYLWDAGTGREIRQWRGHEVQAVALSFSAKGDRLAVSDHSDIWVWEVTSGKLVQLIEGKVGVIDGVALSPDGKAVAGAGMGIWDVAAGTVLHEAPAKSPHGRALVFSRDGKFLITAGAEGIAVWDATSGKKVRVPSGPALRYPCVALSPEGKGETLAVGDYDDQLYLWDWSAGKKVRQFPRQVLPVQSLAFSRDGKTLAAGGNWGSIHLWDVATGQPTASAVVGHEEGLTSVVCGPPARIITTGWDGSVRIWDGQSSKEKLRLEIAKDERNKTDMIPGGFRAGAAAQMLGHLVLSADGKLLAAARWDGIVMIWNATTGKEVKRLEACRLAFSPDNKLIATLEYSASQKIHQPDLVRIYDRETGKRLHELHGPATQWYEALVFLPDSKSLLAIEKYRPPPGSPSFSDLQFVLWDVATGKERRTFPSVGADNHELTLSPDGRTIAARRYVGSSNGGSPTESVVLWETATGGQRGEIVGHRNAIGGVAFSPDGQLVAIASLDGARLWDLFSGKEIARLEGHRGWAGALAFSGDGKTLVTGSTDSTALVWDLSRVPPRAGPVELSPADLEACWKDLRGDARAGFVAIGRLIASPRQAAHLLSEKLQPAPKGDEKRIAQLITDLGSEQFETRKNATKELEKLGDAAMAALEKALTGNIALELRQRLERLLDLLDDTHPTPDRVREMRAMETLEQIGTEEARRLLDRLATAGAAGARLTRDAEAVRQRLNRD